MGPSTCHALEKQYILQRGLMLKKPHDPQKPVERAYGNQEMKLFLL
jgi:hypothetical protein